MPLLYTTYSPCQFGEPANSIEIRGPYWQEKPPIAPYHPAFGLRAMARHERKPRVEGKEITMWQSMKHGNTEWIHFCFPWAFNQVILGTRMSTSLRLLKARKQRNAFAGTGTLGTSAPGMSPFYPFNLSPKKLCWFDEGKRSSLYLASLFFLKRSNKS